MTGVVEAVPVDPAELHEHETVCPRCRLVVWAPAHTAETCDR